MNGHVQPLLHVHARAERLGGAEYDADFAGVDLVEDFDLPRVGHAAFDDRDLVRRNAARDKFPLHVVEEAEIGRALGLVLVAIAEHGNRSATLLRGVQVLKDQFDGLVRL